MTERAVELDSIGMHACQDAYMEESVDSPITPRAASRVESVQTGTSGPMENAHFDGDQVLHAE